MSLNLNKMFFKCMFMTGTLTFVIDLQKEWREDPNGEFKRKVARCVRKSQEMAFD